MRTGFLVRYSEKLKALDRTMMALETKFGRPATDQEIAETMGISSQEVSELMVRMGEPTFTHWTISLKNLRR